MAGTPSDAAPRVLARRDLLLMALTFAAGVSDVVSYVGLGNIFTANTTGNAVFLALGFAQGSWAVELRSIVALAGFSIGAIAAGRLLGRSRGSGPWPPEVTRVLWGELVLVAAFAIGWAVVGGTPSATVAYGLIGVSALSMGMQSAAARRLAVPGVTTTVVTTALTGFMAEFAALGIAGPDQRRWAVTLGSLVAGALVGGSLMLVARPVTPFVNVAVALGVGVASTMWFTPSAGTARADGG